jgi:hypothetical protein
MKQRLIRWLLNYDELFRSLDNLTLALLVGSVAGIVLANLVPMAYSVELGFGCIIVVLITGNYLLIRTEMYNAIEDDYQDF